MRSLPSRATRGSSFERRGERVAAGGKLEPIHPSVASGSAVSPAMGGLFASAPKSESRQPSSGRSAIVTVPLDGTPIV